MSRSQNSNGIGNKFTASKKREKKKIVSKDRGIVNKRIINKKNINKNTALRRRTCSIYRCCYCMSYGGCPRKKENLLPLTVKTKVACCVLRESLECICVRVLYALRRTVVSGACHYTHCKNCMKVYPLPHGYN